MKFFFFQRSGAAAVLLACCAFAQAQTSAPAAAAQAQAPAQAASVEPGLHENQRFAGYSPLARTTTMFERMMSPLWAQQALDAYAAKGETPPDYTLDLDAERYTLYVPDTGPGPRGYGLVVFVPPWRNAAVPRRWRKVLNEHGVLFVTAANSGNDALEIPRRVALALHEYANVSKAFRVDPERVYIAGFSGGGRVALRMAIGYPDVFRGALVDGASDNIGSFLVPLPDPELLYRAQEHSRLIYLYGTDDEANAMRARYSMASAQALCINDVTKLPMFHRAHLPADATTWERGLELLEQPLKPPPADLEACRQRVEAEAAAGLAEVTALVDRGKTAEARKAVAQLDARFAHLVWPETHDLAKKLPPQ
jgi:pimeloyl-ACP methyl ester carboxylesterase